MVDNFGGNQSFQVKGFKDVRINVVELLLHPANYLGMLAKVQRKIVDKSYLLPPYYILASFAYFYIRCLNFFENEDKWIIILDKGRLSKISETWKQRV